MEHWKIIQQRLRGSTSNVRARFQNVKIGSWITAKFGCKKHYSEKFTTELGTRKGRRPGTKPLQDNLIIFSNFHFYFKRTYFVIY